MSSYTVLATAFILGIILYFFEQLTGIKYLDYWPRVILGVAGFFLMLIMHIYSIKKRKGASFFKKVKLPSFLNWHIFTATAGVTFIIFHAIGSYDSIIAWVAFFSMFIVWQSGFVGRYIFIRIPKDHKGVSQEKQTVTEEIESLNREFIESMSKNNEDEKFQEIMIQYLSDYGQSLHTLHTRTDGSFLQFFGNFNQLLKAWKYYRSSKSALEHHNLTQLNNLDAEQQKVYSDHMNEYSEKMRRILLLHFQMEFNDILKALFKNWHDIHVPLTYLFYTTAVLHILVVVLFSASAK